MINNTDFANPDLTVKYESVITMQLFRVISYSALNKADILI